MNPLIIGGIGRLLERGLDILFPDPNVAAQHKIELLKMEQEGAFKELDMQLQLNLAQAKINEVEAASESLLKSGWRPAFGWVGVFVLVSELVIRPYLPWIMEVFGFHVPMIPSIDTEMFWPLIFGLLGLGGMRSWDKTKRTS